MDRDILRIAAEVGTPFYLYDMAKCDAMVQSIRQEFDGRFEISYAVKSNPNPWILRHLRDTVDMLDISSAGELQIALDAGWPPGDLSFTGPGKSDQELDFAVSSEVGAVVVESTAEASRLNSVASQQGRVQDILIRITPAKVPRGFGVNMAGKPCQFGIDEEVVDESIRTILACKNLRSRGLHIYSGTQCLAAEAVAENYEIFAEVFRSVCEHQRFEPEIVVFGSGLGIPYHEGDQPIDLSNVAARSNPVVDQLREHRLFRHCRFVLETGRYLIGEAGFYVVRVVHKKQSRGTEICVCDGGMNQHLGACGHLGSVIHRNYQMFKVDDDGHGATSKYDLVGPLCTTIDTLGHNVELPRLDVGDLIAIRCSGAYGASASPIHFISHSPPKEVMLERDSEPPYREVSQFVGMQSGPCS